MLNFLSLRRWAIAIAWELHVHVKTKKRKRQKIRQNLRIYIRDDKQTRIWKSLQQQNIFFELKFNLMNLQSHER